MYLVSLMDPRYFCRIITQFAKCLRGKGLNGATCIIAAPRPKHGNQYPNFVSLYEGQDALLHYCIIRYMLPGCMSIELSKQYNDGWPWGNRVSNHAPRSDSLPNESSPEIVVDTLTVKMHLLANLSQSRGFVILSIYTRVSYVTATSIKHALTLKKIFYLATKVE